MKKIIIFIIVSIFTITTPIYANNEINPIATKWFNNFSAKLEKKSLALNDRAFKKELAIIEAKNKEIFIKNPELKWFKYYSNNPDNIIFEDWIRYTLIFESLLRFEEWSKVTKRDLLFNWIKPEEALVFVREEGDFGFVTDYKKVKLISNDILYWVTQKYDFLKEIKDDKKKLVNETDVFFKDLKEKTIELTNWKTDNEKIKIIYNYILANIKYSENFHIDDPKIYSWIQSFKNKDWVCEWYTKVFLYMTSFAGINDIELIRWFVLDAVDFPKIWHAWIRHGNSYYDPTFDDPVWQTETRKESEYHYFWLPKDLFYTNRFDLDKVPEELKTKSLDERKIHILKNIVPLLNKYENSWYNILRTHLLKKKHDIKLMNKFDLDSLKKILPFHEVIDFRFIKDWKTILIKNLAYYKMEDDLVEDLIKQLNYDFTGHYLLKWKLEDWSYEYRVGYNLELH